MEQVNLFKSGFYAATLVENDFSLHMVQDVLNFDTISEEDLDKVAHAIQQFAGSIKSIDDLYSIINPFFVPDRSYLSASLCRIISNIRKDSIRNVYAQLALWILDNKDNYLILSSEQLKGIIDKLERFLIPLETYEKARKAKELQTATGNLLHNVEIYNNVRPVFNEERTQIEDNVCFLTLKMDYLDQMQNERTFEITLDQDDLDSLLKKVLLAQRKLRIIQKYYSDNQVS